MNELVSLVIPVVGPILGVSCVNLRGVTAVGRKRSSYVSPPPLARLRGERAFYRLGPLFGVAVNYL